MKFKIRLVGNGIWPEGPLNPLESACKIKNKNRTSREKNSAKQIAPRAKNIQQICGTFKIDAINTDPPIIQIFPK
jgi:hypothetical protein